MKRPGTFVVLMVTGQKQYLMYKTVQAPPYAQIPKERLKLVK